MATIAIGDVHGHLEALVDLLQKVRAVAEPRDTVVFLGDYLDRGPDSKGCVEAIIQFEASLDARVVCLKGNHEDWFERTRRDYRRHSWLVGMEALTTIASYSQEAADEVRAALAAASGDLYLERKELPYGRFFDSVPESHLRFFDSLTVYHRSEDCLCSHAGVDPGVVALDKQTHRALMWGHRSFPATYNGSDHVVYGHWDNAEVDDGGWPSPLRVGRTTGIDTISHGVLTAVRMPDGFVIQSARYLTEPPEDQA